MDAFVQEVRHALRAVRKRPGDSMLVISTLAIAIGANTVIFSAMNAVLLRPLPYPEAQQLVDVSMTVERERTERRELSYPDFADIREQARSFSDLAAYDSAPLTIDVNGEPERVLGERVTDGYFATLGMAPALGHTLSTGDDGDMREVVIGDGLWKRGFGGEPRVLGRALLVGGETRTIVGVMPPGFAGLTDAAEIWLPLSSMPSRALESRSGRFLDAVGRLRPDAGIDDANRELGTIAARLEAAYPDDNRGYGARVSALREQILGDFRRPLLLLAVAVGFVLLIACTNLVNLLLTRAAGRAHESAVRAALGASRYRLVRHFLAEVLALSLAGGALGLAAAWWLVRLLPRVTPIALPSFVDVGIDTRVVLFTTALSLGLGVLLALLASRRALGGAGLDALGGRSVRTSQGRGHRRFRGALVVTEVALALTLLIGAGLMMESFARLRSVDGGFAKERLVFFRFDFGEASLEGPAIAGIGRELRERLSGVAGVEQLALASDTPLDGIARAQLVTNEIMQPDPTVPWDGAVRVYWHRVSDGFFSTMEIPLLRGRDFEAADQQVPATTAIVSRRLAERLWPGDEPLGRRLRIGRPGDDREGWLTVVGVVDDVRYRRLVPDGRESPDDPDLYLPLEGYGNLAVAIRTAIDPAVIFEDVRRTVSAFDRRYAVFGLTTIEERLREETSLSRFSSMLMAAFALLALLLSGIGVYGVMSHAVGARTREIGIRMALGAGQRSVLASVVAEGMGLVLSGSVLGLVAALGLTRFLSSLLHETSPANAGVYAAMTIVLMLVALLACYLPARRASRVDPVVALRQK